MIARRPLLLGAAASLIASPAFAQGADAFLGEWYGALEAGAVRLRLRFQVSAGPAVTLYSIDQGNAAVPASEARIENDRIVIGFAAINARFAGRFANGRIEGTFTQGAPLPLSLGREPIAGPEVRPLPPPGPLTQDRLAALRTHAGAPGMGAAAAKRDGRSIAFADGLRAVGQPQAVTTSDQWHLGSITKSMTSTLVARLAEQGAVSWDDSVAGVLGRAVPNMRDEYRRVTYRHLCSHRGGLQGNVDPARGLQFPRASADARADRIEYAGLALAQPPVGPAEQTFTYSNNGYVIAGAMLEARMGAAWETLIREHVFAPLGMTSAGFGAPGTPGAYDQPVGHAPGANGLTPFPPSASINDNPVVLGPAGRVHANFEDVLKYLAAHRDRTSFLRAESWATLHTPPFGGDYAMGWIKRGDALTHGGSNTLWLAEVGFNAANGIVAAAAVNDGRLPQVQPAVMAALQCAGLAVA